MAVETLICFAFGGYLKLKTGSKNLMSSYYKHVLHSNDEI
jgi:hypothetical protein